MKKRSKEKKSKQLYIFLKMLESLCNITENMLHRKFLSNRVLEAPDSPQLYCITHCLPNPVSKQKISFALQVSDK